MDKLNEILLNIMLENEHGLFYEFEDGNFKKFLSQEFNVDGIHRKYFRGKSYDEIFYSFINGKFDIEDELYRHWISWKKAYVDDFIEECDVDLIDWEYDLKDVQLSDLKDFIK